MIKRYRSILLGVVVLFASCGINAEKSNSADVDEELEEDAPPEVKALIDHTKKALGFNDEDEGE